MQAGRLPRLVAVGTVLAAVLAACSTSDRASGPAPGETAPSTVRATEEVVAEPFLPRDVEVGDPTVSYANVEVTAGQRYLVWFEASGDAAGTGVMWHCAIDPATGDLVPRDGKGFRAFESTLAGRANPGRDREGVYYVGLDASGRLIRVRPTGATTGDVDVLDAAADLNRRGIYPTNTPDRDVGYVLWIANERVPGSGADPRNAWVELRYASLDDPADEHVVRRQERLEHGMAPLDVGFVRWIQGTDQITFGAADDAGRLQVALFDASAPARGVELVTDDERAEIDPYGVRFDGDEYLLAGLGGSSTSGIYERADGTGDFTLSRTLDPPDSALTAPALAQSHEPIEWGGELFSAYQINDRSSGFFATAFQSPGEIWLATIVGSNEAQWLLNSPEPLVRAEPEPYAGADRAWVFYTAAEPTGVGSLTTTTWHLRRADTPLVTS